MITLGISYDFHDASIAVVDDGKLLAASAEERYSLQKHDPSFPALSAQALLKQLDISSNELDQIVFYEKPHEKFTRVLDSAFSGYPSGAGKFYPSMKKWLGSALWKRNTIARELGVSPLKIEYASHHQSHMVQAFATSPFEEAAVLVIDAVGEWTSTSLAYISDRSGPSSIKTLETYDYPFSIGLVYSAFTVFLGFKPNSGESSTMALAGYGESRYTALIEQVIRRNSDNTYHIEPSYFNFDATDDNIFNAKFIELFSEPRNFKQAYGFSAIDQEQHGISLQEQYFADIAASLQTVLEDIILGLCVRLKQQSPSGNLCFAGGVALNCIANSLLLKKGPFKNLFIPFEPGDGGAAMGAAFIGNQYKQATTAINPYLGTNIETDSIQAFLDNKFLCDLYRENKIAQHYPIKAFRIEKIEDEAQLLSRTADELASGKIVGWAQGRFEFGPRALGARSILIDPQNTKTLSRLSQHVKSHGAFRPYAISMHQEVGESLLDCQYCDQTPLKWMQTVWPVRQEYHQSLRAGLHTDNTTRPQLCSKKDNARYWGLLEQMKSHVGAPALLNTSFNERGMPIVANASHALTSFMRTAIDTLVIDNIMIRKIQD
jgi:carbamoyltransferase